MSTGAAVPSERPTLEHEGFSVSSNTGTVEDLQHELGVEAPEPDSQHATAEDPGADPDSTDAPLKSRDAHKRIAKTTYEREEANRQAEAARAEAEALKAENARLKAERERPRADDAPRRTEDEQKRYEQWKAGHDPSDKKPEEGEFDSYAQYLDARDEWNERRVDRKHERAAQERQQFERQARIQQAATTFQSRMDKEVQKDPEFKAILDRVQIPQGPILDVFLTTDVPEGMARYFDANPDVLQKIIAMPSASRQLAEMKRIEGRVEAQLEVAKAAAPSGSAPAPKTTKAHPPINPVVGSHVAAGDEEPGDDASDEAWFAWQERQRKAKR